MEILQLEAFERAAREGNFTRAAEAMGLTQPAVSMRISSLEAEIGGKLFERKGRHLELTPLGERFLPYAQRMLAVMADGLQAVRDFRNGKVGEVRIAAPTPFVLSFLVDALDEFRRQHPTIDIWIRERNKSTITRMIHDNTTTLGLVNAPVFDQQMVALAQVRDPIRCVVGQSHPLTQYAEQDLTIDALYRHTIFRVSMFPQMTHFIDEVVERGREGSGGAVIAIPMVMALNLVRQGQGITFLPEGYVRAAVEHGDLHFLKLHDMPPLMSEALLIAHRERELDNLHQHFVDIIAAQWQNLR